MTRTFDSKCWDLACHFLADLPDATDEDRIELAVDFQALADDYCNDLEGNGCCRSCGACPGFIGAECDETCDHVKAASQSEGVQL